MYKARNSSLKILIGFVFFFAICLAITISVNAFAISEEDGLKVNGENNPCILTFKMSETDGNLVVEGQDANEKTYIVESGSTVVQHTTNEGFGQLCLHQGDTEKLIATVYPCYDRLFDGWNTSPINEANNEEWTVNSDMTFTAKVKPNDFANGAVVTGTVCTGSEDSLENLSPVPGVRVYFKVNSDEVCATYSDKNGHFRLLGVPFDTIGVLNGEKEGFVSDYTSPLYFSKDPSGQLGMDAGICVIPKGAAADVVSNKPDAMFKVSKLYENVDQRMELALVDEINTPNYMSHQFPEGAWIRVLPTDETVNLKGGGTRTFKAGSLAYGYVFHWGIVGGIRYEVYYEPSSDFPSNGWTYSNADHSNVAVPVVAKDDEETQALQISLEQGKYTFNMNYGEKYQAAQTGDANLPIVIALIVVACACGGYIAYRKFRKK